MLNFVNCEDYIDEMEIDHNTLCHELELDEHDLRQAFVSSIQDAHEALFATFHLNGGVEDLLYAAPRIFLRVGASVQELAQLKPFALSSGEIVQGLLVSANDVGSASYLMLDAIEAARTGTFDTLLRTPGIIGSHIGRNGGYPTIDAWETSDGAFLIPEAKLVGGSDIPF